ncbi:MAG: DUF4013 domain-containing protein [Anaerolineae bacterium]|nr:DUF4013 domain-containing protein [Anaerolineae bacterium]
MNLTGLMNSILNDRDYIVKLAITAALTIFSILFTPVLIGFVGWSLLLGYQVSLMRNVRQGNPTPLPAWDNMMRFLTPGANVLVAFLIYNIPNMFFGCGWAFIVGISGGAQIVGSTVTIASICCLLPIILIYNLLMLPFFALGLGRFVEEPRLNTFFAFGQLYDSLSIHVSETVQYVVYVFVTGLIIGLLAIIPILGWAFIAALWIPITGLLNGQYARLAIGSLKPEKSKPARPAPAPHRPRR